MQNYPERGYRQEHIHRGKCASTKAMFQRRETADIRIPIY